MHNSQWTEFNSQMKPKRILSFPWIKPAFTKKGNTRLQSVSEISRQGQSKDPSWTYFTNSELAGLGFAFFWQRSEQTVEEAELLVIWASGENKAMSQQESNSPEWAIADAQALGLMRNPLLTSW